MSSVQNYPTDYTDIPEREYYVAPRKGRKRRRLRLLPLLLALRVVGGGFRRGRAQAAQTSMSDDACLPTLSGGSTEEECGIIPVPPAIPGAGTSSGGETAENWELILVNGENPLSEDFSVPELTQLKNDQSIDNRAYPSLQEMMDAARAAGYEP